MVYAGNKEVEQIAGEIKVTTGLEFLKDVRIGPHLHTGFKCQAIIFRDNISATLVAINSW